MQNFWKICNAVGFNVNLHVCDIYNILLLSIAIRLTAEASKRLQNNNVAIIASGNRAILIALCLCHTMSNCTVENMQAR